MKRIGLLGGSFDPPHKGHLYISNEAKKILLLDEIWWLITPQNPLKISKPATYNERVANCKKISKGKPIVIKEIFNFGSWWNITVTSRIQNYFESIFIIRSRVGIFIGPDFGISK